MGVKVLQQLAEARIGLGAVAVVGAVVGEEALGHLFYVIFVERFGRKSLAEQVVNAPSHHLVIGGNRVPGVSQVLQGVVDGVSQVLYRIQQGAVQIKNDKPCLGHKKFSKKIYLCNGLAQGGRTFATEIKTKVS